MNYKVGDRVRFPEGTRYAECSIMNPNNEVGVIVGIDEDDDWYTIEWSNGKCLRYWSEDLELAEEVLYYIN